jgi:hypothetical protein
MKTRVMTWMFSLSALLGAAGAFAQAPAPAPVSPSGIVQSPEAVTGCPACPDSELPKNYLGGHRYNPSLFFPAPFLTPYFTFAMGLGRANQTVDVAGESHDLKLIGYAPTLDAQFLAFKKLIINLGFAGGIASGMNAESTLIYGAAINYQLNIGGLYNIVEEKNWVLAFGFNVLFPHQLAVTPLRGIVSNLENTLEAANEFVSQTSARTYRPNFRFAYAINQVFGTYALIGYNFSDKDTEEGQASNSGATFGVGLDVQLKPVINFPLGLNASYIHGLNITGTHPSSDYVFGGVFETIGQRYSAGIEGGRIFSTRDAWLGALVTRYYY